MHFLTRLFKDALFTWAMMALGLYGLGIAIEHRFPTVHETWVLLQHLVQGVNSCLQ